MAYSSADHVDGAGRSESTSGSSHRTVSRHHGPRAVMVPTRSCVVQSAESNWHSSQRSFLTTPQATQRRCESAPAVDARALPLRESYKAPTIGLLSTMAPVDP